jgi:hypothetical protein
MAVLTFIIDFIWQPDDHTAESYSLRTIFSSGHQVRDRSKWGSRRMKPPRFSEQSRRVQSSA